MKFERFVSLPYYCMNSAVGTTQHCYTVMDRKACVFMSGMWPKFAVNYVEPWVQHQLIASWMKFKRFLCLPFYCRSSVDDTTQHCYTVMDRRACVIMSGMWPKFVASYVKPWFQHQLIASRWSSKGSFLYHITVLVQPLTQLNFAIQLWIEEHLCYLCQASGQNL